MRLFVPRNHVMKHSNVQTAKELLKVDYFKICSGARIFMVSLLLLPLSQGLGFQVSCATVFKVKKLVSLLN